MPLSEQAPPAGGAPITAYAFEQLDAPAQGSIGAVADVLSAAWAEAEEVRVQARLAGEAAGRAEGLAAARAEAEPALHALACATRAVEELKGELVAALERDAVELALRLSEQILGGVLAVKPEYVLDVARGALRRLADRHRVTLVVNPTDLEFVRESIDALRTELGGIDHLDVHADRRVGRGGVLARTDAGEIDATMEAQMVRARELVTAALGEQVLDGD
jgi:flagellar assembly protein FliH